MTGQLPIMELQPSSVVGAPFNAHPKAPVWSGAGLGSPGNSLQLDEGLQEVVATWRTLDDVGTAGGHISPCRVSRLLLYPPL